jgi:uncharacterized damage-inducible protein DinB
MKLALRLIVCALVVGMSAGFVVRGGVAQPAAQAAKTQTVLGDLLKDWQNQKSIMLGIAEAMPEDKFGFKPTVPQRTYGEQIMHVAQVNVDLLKAIGGKAAPPSFGAEDAAKKAAVIKALADSYDYGTALLKEQTDSSLSELVRAPLFVGTGAGAVYVGPSTRARIFWFLLGHSMDIYGQMAVYLRMSGVVPPASRG